MIVRCTDAETTGLDPKQGAAICELGWTDVSLSKDGSISVGRPQSILVNPGHKIPPEMSAIHHIVDADVAMAPKFDDAFAPLLKDGTDIVFAAHRAKFEQLFITAPLNWICTWKVAVTLAPNAPAHNLQTLRYWLNLAVDRDDAEPPHRAGPDSYICAHLVARMMAKLTVTEMVRISSGPVILPKLHFGMHVGKPIAEVPESYWDWVLGPKGITDDEDVRHTAFHELSRRRQAT